MRDLAWGVEPVRVVSGSRCVAHSARTPQGNYRCHKYMFLMEKRGAMSTKAARQVGSAHPYP